MHVSTRSRGRCPRGPPPRSGIDQWQLGMQLWRDTCASIIGVIRPQDGEAARCRVDPASASRRSLEKAWSWLLFDGRLLAFVGAISRAQHGVELCWVGKLARSNPTSMEGGMSWMSLFLGSGSDKRAGPMLYHVRKVQSCNFISYFFGAWRVPWLSTILQYISWYIESFAIIQSL